MYIEEKIMVNSFQLQTLLLWIVGGRACFAFTAYLDGKNSQSDYLYGYKPDVHLQEPILQNEGYFYPDNLPQNMVAGSGALKHQTVVELNPLIAALLLGTSLALPQKSFASNHPGLPPVNPYVALILSNYGRYLPLPKTTRGIYAYAAANSYHNYQPGGTYKVTEEK
ncbi:unnamed protein product [Brassicogethes aeneus]|uniref:Uncharacterized protein n=1 Tax=Brassicogethes aeneus TaxID=1431903 RepID=A0A9P0FJP2_BRAAE|nr:unnamed protein product [Brassicogethes aeneus]